MPIRIPQTLRPYALTLAACGSMFVLAARDYLTKDGGSRSSLTVRSRGAQDANGRDSDGWQLDRRVEIQERLAVAR